MTPQLLAPLPCFLSKYFTRIERLSWWSKAKPRPASACSATSRASLGCSVASPRLGNREAEAMLHAAKDAQLPVLGHSKVELWRRVDWGSVTCSMRWCSTVGTCCSYVESFGATRTKLVSECVLLVFVCP